MIDKLQEYISTITFIKELERLKDTKRTAWTKEGRQESVAEHSWRLSLFAFALEEYITDIDFGRVIRICLIHDFGEAYEGDIPAIMEEDQQEKLKREEQALIKLIEPLSENTRTKFLALWWEYNLGETKEAKLAKALDKMETIIQHNQGNNPDNFDYPFNLEYGRKHAQFDPIISYIRDIIDSDTKNKIKL